MYLTGSNYDKYEAFRSLEEALEFTEFEEEELSGEKPISLGIGRDEDGELWFAVASENVFTSCNYSDLESWQDWYDEEWIEEEEN